MVLKSSIHTLASPQRQQSHWGLRVTKDAYILLLTYNKQLLLVTFCSMLAGIEVSVRTHGRNERNHGQTDVEVEIVIQMALSKGKIVNFQFKKELQLQLFLSNVFKPAC